MRKKKLVNYSKYGYLFSIPFILAFLVFMCYPTLNTLILGFTDLKGAGKTEWKFLPEIGKPLFQNYIEVLKSSTFKKAFTNTWILWGISVIPKYVIALFFAAIMGIAVEIFEAAEIDGANRFQTFFKITIPCMRQVLIYILVMSSLGGLNLYDTPAIIFFIMRDKDEVKLKKLRRKELREARMAQMHTSEV